MKLMIASDIHGSAFYCRKMLDAYKREGAAPLFLSETSFITVRVMTCQKITIQRK